MDLQRSSVKRVMVAGEPGGGEPAMRAKLEAAWGASVTEAMGIGDISVSLWGECEQKQGMHFSGRGFVHIELIDPETGAAKPIADGAEGELVLTHLVNRSAPLLRFRTRDHVRLSVGRCACGRTSPRVRCIGRTDDMLIVRGVNVFPSAVREVVNEFAARGRRRRRDPATREGHKTGAAAARQRRNRARRRCRGASGAYPRPLARKASGDDGDRASAGGQSAAQRIQIETRRKSMRRDAMQKLQTQGVHHITLVGADRQTSIDFWEGVLGMPFIFEQPNLDNAAESHIYFDPGDGRLITVFTREDRKPVQRRTPTDTGCVHHIAFNVSRAVWMQAVQRLDERGIKPAVRDRMFMDSIYFEDPLGLLIELACYKFEPPAGYTHADVLFAAHNLRVARGDRAIMEVHLADAIECSSRDRPRASRPTARRRTHTSAAMRLSSSKPNRRKPHVCDQAARDQAKREQYDGARFRARGEARFHRGRRLRQDAHR